MSKEITALQKVVLQNRTVLDLVTATSGEVCTLLNETYCTYIPDGTGDGHTVSEALAQLKEIRKGMQQDARRGQGGLLSWLTFGPCWQLLLKIMIPFLIILMLFFAFSPCVSFLASE
ncbi:hypothetical protein ILYODFUR_031071 [Ilyodon furcidens]|uniref:Uncharacterized protein n=1 Tax=Ilyodon furcidens TaxID=33524 RepID=A0ABV0T4E7_9TELE